MAGTKEGAKKAAIVNLQRHGSDFYKRIGRLGGSKSTTRGFAAHPEKASEAGRLGGKRSRVDKYSREFYRKVDRGEIKINDLTSVERNYYLKKRAITPSNIIEHYYNTDFKAVKWGRPRNED